MKDKTLTLNNKNIISDGAMGTYYSIKTGMSSNQCELANLTNPEIIESIHYEYLVAGARFIRTNTFAANTAITDGSIDEAINIVKSGYRIAKKAIDKFINEYKRNKNVEYKLGEDVYLAADIGPIYNDNYSINEENILTYEKIVDAFLKEGATLFIFETFADTTQLNKIVDYIKEVSPNAFIIASFAFSPDGYTRFGQSVPKIIADVNEKIDMLGMNCGSGPTHMINLLNKYQDLFKKKNKKLSIMPNAGYPSIENNRTVFTTSADYFAETASKIAYQFATIIGGCCGTTPNHIHKLANVINNEKDNKFTFDDDSNDLAHENKVEVVKNLLSLKMKNNEFITLTEFSPPVNSDISKLIDGAKLLKKQGNDAITLSDSPLARVKMDSIIAASKISREVKITCLPHLCCRDKNVNALRASILGAYSEGIRNILAVTGDIVPEDERGAVKPVFNVGSIGLMKMISDMNDDVFKQDPINIGGALDNYVVNKAAELKKAKRKIENGCTFFLTQPIYDAYDLSVVDEVRNYAKVFIGIMPIVSYRNAMYMKNEVPGFSLSDNFVNLFKPEMSKEEAVQIGLELAYNLAEQLRPHADGFYFVAPFNRAQIIVDLLKKLQENKVI